MTANQDDDIFEVWYLKNGTTVGQIHGSLIVNSSSLTLRDEDNNKVFAFPKSITGVIAKDVDRITITVNNHDYVLLLVNRFKSAAKQAVLGPVWGGGGKNGVFSPQVQQMANYLFESLQGHGYQVVIKKAKLTTKQLVIIIIGTILISAITIPLYLKFSS